MPEETIEIVRRGHEAFREGGEQAIYSYLDPDIELTAIEELPGNESHYGHSGVHDWFQTLREAFGGFTWEPQEYVDLGEHVLVATRFIAEGRGSGVPVEVTVYNLWTVRQGKVVQVRGYLSREDALAVASRAE